MICLQSFIEYFLYFVPNFNNLVNFVKIWLHFDIFELPLYCCCYVNYVNDFPLAFMLKNWNFQQKIFFWHLNWREPFLTISFSEMRFSPKRLVHIIDFKRRRITIQVNFMWFSYYVCILWLEYYVNSKNAEKAFACQEIVGK